jgi:hypothetical protein
MVTQRFNPPDLTDAVENSIGPYNVALVYRNVGSDQGPTVHVFGPVDGADQEILRFDCFRKVPHFHLGFSYLSSPVVPIDAADPLGWVLSQLCDDFPGYLQRSEAAVDLPDNWQSTMTEVSRRFTEEAQGWSE